MNIWLNFRRFSPVIVVICSLLCVERAQAVTSPYVTQSTDVPLNQSTTDSVNGILPYFTSDSEREGSFTSLTDATSANTPTENVILGPDNTWVGVAWDFGDPPAGYIWRLDRLDAWIAAGDNLRKGYRADISVSNSGDLNDFTVVSNSLHWAGLTQNAQYNCIRYDFPTEFVSGGTNDAMHKFPVKGFRYLRLNSRGDSINSVDWQTRFVEFDIWVSQEAVPSENPTFTSISRSPGGDVTLTWTTISGRTYDIEYKDDLNDGNWINLDTVIADSDTETILDTSTSGAQRYYRVSLEP